MHVWYVRTALLKALLLLVTIQCSMEGRAYVPCFTAEQLLSLSRCLSGSQSLFSDAVFLEAIISDYPRST